VISHDTEQYTFNKIGGESDRKLLRRMLVFAGPHKGALLAAVGVLLAGLFLRLAGPWLFRQIIDGPIARAAETRGTPAFDSDALTSEVARLALIFLGVAAGSSAIAVLREWLMNRTGQAIVLAIRDALFHHTLRLPVSWFDRHHVGWTVTRTTSDVDALSELFTTGIATIAYDIMTIVVVLGVLTWLSPTLTIAAVIVLPIMIWVSFRFRLKARLAYRDTRKSLSQLNGYLQERLTGLDVVRIFRRQEASGARFGELNGQYWSDNMVTVKHFSLFFPTVDMLSWVLRVGTLVMAAWLIADGQMTLGTFIMYWMLLDFVFEPIRELAERYNVLQAAMAAGERIFGIFDAAEEDGLIPVTESVAAAQREAVEDEQGRPHAAPPRATPAAPAPDDEPLVHFDGVSFAYPTGPDVLGDVSFSIRRGQRVAVVGHTGAGKTTLTALICRFHETDRGVVRFDGRDVRDVSHAELRGRVAVVQQDVFLFSDTIAANVRMGDPLLSDDRLVQVSEAVNADRFIDKLPETYATPLLERGANLSSGQRQLVAFARALAADPDLLILDEATSSVDSETEGWIEEATATLLEGRTSLVIAHRLSTVVSADQILVMHKGELREVGTHDELLAQRGLYHRLFKLHLQASAS
jgi:ABC-type multidrug transport system fused ATPase/permease subunit